MTIHLMIGPWMLPTLLTAVLIGFTVFDRHETHNRFGVDVRGLIIFLALAAAAAAAWLTWLFSWVAG
jgi:hypothetical protein